jgi:ATP-dependent Clp protease ATP-binding subunit ClpA
MFERFTDRSRRVVVLAQEEARMLGHSHIGTEHLLLALLHEQSGVPALVLESAGVTLDEARAQVAEIAGNGGKGPKGHIPFTPRAKTVLELALREALELRRSDIRPEHILLGLIRERRGVGAQVLERLGGPLPALRQRVLEAAKSAEPGPDGAEDGTPEFGPWSWQPAHGFARAGQGDPQPASVFRGLFASVDRRLAGIERRLGAAEEKDAPGGMRGLLASIDHRLANIERHLGIDAQPEGPKAGTE